MTRKHFRAIAAALRGLDIRGRHPVTGGKLVLKSEVIHALGKVLAQFNPAFQYSTFLVASIDNIDEAADPVTV